MREAQSKGIRPPSYLRVEERAVALLKRVMQGAHLSPTRKPVYRQWRARGAKPSPVERVLGMCVELHGVGVQISTLRSIPRTVDPFLDDLSCGVAMPTLTVEALSHELVLEHAENVAALRVASGDHGAEALTAYADALEAEALYQLELVRAARHEARTVHLRRAV